MSPLLLALFGIGAGVNAYATAQQIASQSKMLQLQAGMLRENAKDNYGLAKEQSILFTRTAEENARKVQPIGYTKPKPKNRPESTPDITCIF